jgi:predicted ABC-type ATPase
MSRESANPTLYLIAGPNGAGKTTFACTFLPAYTDCTQFINADLIAEGLSPFAPESAALRAGRLVLERIAELSSQRVDFGLESTLSGKTYELMFRRLKTEGYHIFLFFLWLPEVDTAVARVADRVRRGGHNVPETDIRRRYGRGLRNFLYVYRPLLDGWILFDNTGETPIRIANGEGGRLDIRDPQQYARFLEEAKNDERKDTQRA